MASGEPRCPACQAVLDEDTFELNRAAPFRRSTFGAAWIARSFRSLRDASSVMALTRNAATHKTRRVCA